MKFGRKLQLPCHCPWLAGDAIGSTVTDLISGTQYTVQDNGGRGYVNVSVDGHYGVILEQ